MVSLPALLLPWPSAYSSVLSSLFLPVLTGPPPTPLLSSQPAQSFVLQVSVCHLREPWKAVSLTSTGLQFGFPVALAALIKSSLWFACLLSVSLYGMSAPWHQGLWQGHES